MLVEMMDVLSNRCDFWFCSK